MTQTDSNREAFEAWWGTLAPPPPDGPTDPYPCSHQSISLEAWQAATAQALRPIISILHPNGIKHPQQVEPYWVADEVSSLLHRIEHLMA